MQLYLSQLTLNPLNRDVIRDLASPYDMHRTVLRAFPDADDGGPGRVLFRLEESRGPAARRVVLVQSDKPPRWEPLERMPGYLLDVQGKPVDLDLPAGRRLAFRLRANPTVRREGKRHGLFRPDDQLDWLRRKGTDGGFHVLDAAVGASGKQLTRRHRGSSPQVHYAVLFEGLLEVADADRFTETVAAGIGPAKAFGFGLLSLARHCA